MNTDREHEDEGRRIMDREWQTAENAAKRAHELKMAKAQKKGVDGVDVAGAGFLVLLATMTATAVITNAIVNGGPNELECRNHIAEIDRLRGAR